MSKPLYGVCPILATPFFDDGRIDVDGQLRLVDHLLEQGVHGLAAFGNAGEGYTLSADEKRRLQEAIVKRIDGRAPFVVGVGTTGTELAIEACRQAEQEGADALMVLPPYYLRPDGEGVFRFFAAISDAVGIPIMVQDAPMLSQVALPAPLLARMGREIERVEYVKVEAPPTAPKITQIRQTSDGALTLFGGLNGQFFIEEVRRGARGMMPASDMASLYVAIWDALESSDDAAAWEVFRRGLPLMRFELQPGLGVSAIKHNLVERGVIASAAVREPTRTLDAEGLRELAALRSLVWPDR